MSEWEVVARTFAALVAGGAIGLERSFHGRAAGLRTYALVCFGSALLVAGTLFAYAGSADAATRVIQGIVTGIGFLGAGVIVKEGFNVRGLTTAASIWVVSAIGVVIGGGAYLSGAEAAAVTLVALALLRRIEDRLPAQAFLHLEIGFDRTRAIDEAQLREILGRHGFAQRELAYQLHPATQLLEYQMVIWSDCDGDAGALERSLLARPEVVQFRISPSRD
ncbi:MAG TPA: MgtC/SapB family protein [Casimicrobiaceae bacterium]|nr:MgtC/SapB family protein [Casimicrobiaceae bacterium]